jgi:SAM-dependent methyltransferase
LSASESHRVAAQYEKFPYPVRNPDDERQRVIGTWLDNLDIANFRCYRGETPFARGFRALVAGGGTGDATIYLGVQLRNTDAAIVHLDVSAASIDIARRRAAIHGLDQIRFVQASLLGLPSLGLGRFHYINCVGVLHHLADPDEGLRALLEALEERGALALMVYGRYGRVGVYHLQEMLKRLAGDTDDATRLAIARSVVTDLPASNWFKRGEDLHSDNKMGDAGLYDLLLHSNDRAYTVPELYEWLVDRHGLRVHFSDVHRGARPYDPMSFVHDDNTELAQRIAGLPLRERQAIAELWGGDLTRHSFYAMRHSDGEAPYGDLDAIPRIPSETHQPTGADFARLIAEHDNRFVLQHAASGLNRAMDPNPLAAAIFNELDGLRSFRDIFMRVRENPALQAQPPTDATLFAAFAPWFDALASIERMGLLRAACPWPLFVR